MAIAETKPVYQKILIEQSNSIWWSGFDIWEDLILYKNDELIYYVCTHENFGYLYPPNNCLGKVYLPEPDSFNKYDKYKIKGLELNVNTL